VWEANNYALNNLVIISLEKFHNHIPEVAKYYLLNAFENWSKNIEIKKYCCFISILYMHAVQWIVYLLKIYIGQQHAIIIIQNTK